MNDLIGEDIRNRCRRNILVWGRNMVAYCLMRSGLRQKDAADALGMNRSTMVHCANQIKRMLSSPKSYIAEMRLWKKYNNMLLS